MRHSLISCVLLFLSTGCGQNESYMLAPWTTGQWVAYEIRHEGHHEVTKLRYSLVGEEEIKETKYFWFEMESSDGDRRLIFKMLVPDRFRGQALNVIIKVDDAPAEDMSAAISAGTAFDYHPRFLDENKVMKAKIGTERLKTGAGEFHSIQSKMEGLDGVGDVWVSSKVPILGIVKLVSGLATWELVGYGETGAESRITETPKKFTIEEIDRESPEDTTR